MSDRRDIFRRADDWSRRAFLSGTAAGLLGTFAGSVPAMAAPPPPRCRGTARSVIYLYMSGGMSHLDTFDPKEPGSEVMGPTEVRATNVDGIRLGSHFEHLSKVMDRACLVRSMWSTQGAHAQGRYFVHTSYQLRGTIRHPTLGAWLSHLDGGDNPTLPSHVAVGGDIYCASAGFLASRHEPLPLGNPAAGLQHSARPRRVSEETFHRRLARLEAMNRAFADHNDHPVVRAYAEMYQQAVQLMDSKDLRAFDLGKEPERLRAAYGRDRFGQGCLLARRLVEHGVRFVEVVSGGWDTHNQNFEAMAEKVPVIDRALTSLLLDLEARGLLEETLVVVATEFGRTPEIIAARSGRNHHAKAFSCLLAGGGIKGGYVHGSSDARGEEVVAERVTVPDFNATIASALGLDLEQVITSPSGRPFKVAADGHPILAVFA